MGVLSKIVGFFFICKVKIKKILKIRGEATLVMGSSGQPDPLFAPWDEGAFWGHLSKAQEGRS